MVGKRNESGVGRGEGGGDVKEHVDGYYGITGVP